MRNDALIADHMDFARMLALKERQELKKEREYSDLESEAIFGLMKAGRRFKEDKGVPFRAFVKIRIVGAMKDWCSYKNQLPFLGLLEDNRLTEEPVWTDVALRLSRAAHCLPRRERYLIGQYFYFGATLSEIAAKLHVNESRAMQLRNQALKRLRRALEHRGVRKVADLV